MRSAIIAKALEAFGSARIGLCQVTMTVPPDLIRRSGEDVEMMDDYGRVNSGDWIGMEFL